MIPPVFTEEPVSEEAIASTSSLVSDRALPTPPMTNATTEVMQLKAIPTEIHLLFAASPDHPLNESVPSSQPDTTMTIVTPPAVETEPETVINLSQLPSLAVPELTLSTEDDRFVTSPVEMSQEPSQETDNDDSFVYPTDTTVWVVPAHSHPSMAPGAYKKWMAEQLDEHTPPLTAPLARRLTPKRSKSFAERSMSIVSSELPVIETIMDKEEGNSSSSSLEDEATKSDETLVNTEELMSVRTLEDIPEQQAVSAPVVVVVEEEVEDLTRIPSSATLDRLIKAKKEVLARKELSIETPAFTTTSSSTSTKKMGFFAKALGAFKPPTRDSPRPSNIPESTLYLRSPSSTLPARLPLDQERYVYRLSHLKLSQPKPLVDQILITNMMLQIVAVNDNVTLSRGIQGIRKRMRRRGSGIGKPRSPMGVMERSGRHGAHLSPSRVLVTVPAPAQSSMSWRRSQPQVSVADSDSDSEETKVPVVVIPPRGKSLSPPPFIQSFGPRTPGRSNNHRKSTVTVETEEEDEIPLGLLKA